MGYTQWLSLVCISGCVAEESWLEDDRSQVFMNASILALRDGQLSNGEKRILVKLAHALRLQEDEPKRIYDAILAGKTESCLLYTSDAADE